MPDATAARSPWQHDGTQYWSITFIQAPREVVFDHLVRAEHTVKFYFGMPINEPRAVGDAVWYGKDAASAPIRGIVTALEAPARFAHTFVFAHNEDPPTTVEFRLHAEGPDLTRLEVRHFGFGPEASATYDDICGGWPVILSDLKTLLETGRGIAWPRGEAEGDG